MDAQFQAHVGDSEARERVGGGDLAAAALVVLAVQQNAVVQLGVVGGDEAAFAGREWFGAVEAECGRGAEGAGALVVPGGAVGVRARELHELLGMPTHEASVNITRSRLGRLTRQGFLTQPERGRYQKRT